MLAKESPKAPSNQPFNVNGRHSTKINSWFSPKSSTYWRSKKK